MIRLSQPDGNCSASTEATLLCCDLHRPGPAADHLASPGATNFDALDAHATFAGASLLMDNLAPVVRSTSPGRSDRTLEAYRVHLGSLRGTAGAPSRNPNVPPPSNSGRPIYSPGFCIRVGGPCPVHRARIGSCSPLGRCGHSIQCAGPRPPRGRSVP